MRLMEQERRFGRREAVQLRARIDTAGGRTIEVTVRDLSFSGCRIEKPENVQIPQRFTLCFVDLARADAEAEIVWQRGGEAGARFLTADDTGVPKRAPEAGVQKLSLGELRKIAGRAD